jgi:hypothetical protein
VRRRGGGGAASVVGGRRAWLVGQHEDGAGGRHDRGRRVRPEVVGRAMSEAERCVRGRRWMRRSRARPHALG